MQFQFEKENTQFILHLEEKVLTIKVVQQNQHYQGVFKDQDLDQRFKILYENVQNIYNYLQESPTSIERFEEKNIKFSDIIGKKKRIFSLELINVKEHKLAQVSKQIEDQKKIKLQKQLKANKLRQYIETIKQIKQQYLRQERELNNEIYSFSLEIPSQQSEIEKLKSEYLKLQNFDRFLREDDIVEEQKRKKLKLNSESSSNTNC